MSGAVVSAVRVPGVPGGADRGRAPRAVRALAAGAVVVLRAGGRTASAAGAAPAAAAPFRGAAAEPDAPPLPGRAAAVPLALGPPPLPESARGAR